MNEGASNLAIDERHPPAEATTCAAADLLGGDDRILRILMDTVPDTIFFKDREGRFLRVNWAEARHLGLDDPAHAVGRTDFDFYPADLAQEYAADERRIIETGRPMIGKVEQCKPAGQPPRWFSTTKVALRDDRGVIVGTFGISRDVTGQRQAHEALCSSERSRTSTERALEDHRQLLRSIIEGSEDGIFVKDLEGRYLLVNSADAQILGRSGEEIIGRSDRDLFPPEVARSFARRDRRVIATGRSIQYEQELDVPGRGRQSFLVGKYPRLDPRGKIIGVIGIVRNVSRQREFEEEAQKLRDDLAHLNRVGTMGQMAAALAHELNQPLAAISNYANGCVRRLGANTIDHEQLVEVAHRIAAQAEQAANVLRRVGGFVRKGAFRRCPQDLNEVVRTVADLARWQLRRHRVTLVLDLHGEKLVTEGDPVQLQQVVLNLVQNACDAMASAERRSLVIRTTATPDEVAVAVLDAGAGIGEEQAARIFDPFFTTKDDGMGMGLAICRSIAEAHGGRLDYEPRPEGGSTFRLRLPRHQDGPDHG